MVSPTSLSKESWVFVVHSKSRPPQHNKTNESSVQTAGVTTDAASDIFTAVSISSAQEFDLVQEVDNNAIINNSNNHNNDTVLPICVAPSNPETWTTESTIRGESDGRPLAKAVHGAQQPPPALTPAALALTLDALAFDQLQKKSCFYPGDIDGWVYGAQPTYSRLQLTAPSSLGGTVGERSHTGSRSIASSGGGYLHGYDDADYGGFDVMATGAWSYDISCYASDKLKLE